ncbi:MAG: hypothetical protein JSU75_08560 [Gammaproteobacteria bacterium]|nr:MAG: hypothetical protein JSU75_08560 [Gammaproteobacteria bacterium]
MTRIFNLALLAILLAGCATTDTVRQEKGMGDKQLFEHPYDAVFEATLVVAGNQGLEVVEQDRDNGTIILSHGVTLWSWGERVAVFIRKMSATQTEVEIISKPVMAPLNFPPDWVSRIFEGIDKELGPPG